MNLPYRRERLVHGVVQSEHRVQLFDDTESLAQTLAAFLLDGWERGEAILVVARPENWAATSRVLAAEGCPIEEAILLGRLVVLDALATLKGLIRNGRPDVELFQSGVGGLVHRLSEESRNTLRIYGEMVDVLAAEGDFTSALELEQLWNELGAEVSFSLLCGYSSGNFGDARTASELRAICDLHDHVSAKSNDLLASWLLAERCSHPHLDPQ